LFQGTGFFAPSPGIASSSSSSTGGASTIGEHPNGSIQPYSIHLFHSQSEGASRYFSCERDPGRAGAKRLPLTNIGEAVRRGVGDDMVQELCRLIDNLPYYSAGIQTQLDANKRKFGLT
jgi:hypothetical protein